MVVRRAKIKPPSPPQGSSKLQTTGKWAKKALRIWLWAFTTVAFMLFICEESTQLLGFSRMNYRNVKTKESYETWAKACERDTKIVNACRIAAGATWIINPISSVTFAMYFDQEQVKLGREIWVAKRLLAQEIAKEEAKQEQTQAAFAPVSAKVEPEVKNGVMVLATPNGQVYHSSNKFCSHVFKRADDGKYKRRTDLRVFKSIEAAQKAGLRPCVRCKPGRN